MRKSILLLSFLAIVFQNACALGSSSGQVNEQGILIDHLCTDIGSIPASAVASAKANLHIAYNHTSHGSQLITGMNCLGHFPYGGIYSWSEGDSPDSLDLRDRDIPGTADLSQGDWVDENGDTPWVVSTRAYLEDPGNSNINVVVWSWCSINGHDAQRYVDNMEKLIREYPTIAFVFMTGHAEGQSEDLFPGSVHYNNELIREHCREKGRILYDFADIEAYDPDGDYFWDKAMRDNLDYTGGNWAVEWISAHPDSELARLTTGENVDGYDGCSGTAHSSSPPRRT